MARRPQWVCTVILKPSVNYLAECGRLLLDAKAMSAFLDIPVSKVHRLAWSDRLPAPIRLGFGHSPRWSVLELLEWVAAGCPRRDEWIDRRGWSGSIRRSGQGLLW
ncbi:MAG: hypothetical protein JW741_30090 [Sedimentisphaerales bacterium]|nr:hypothetical protein [Sedimentisphaerales bacterium]